MTLFQVIQESVDTIYFLEEDTISTANIILDSVLTREIRAIVAEAEVTLRREARDRRVA